MKHVPEMDLLSLDAFTQKLIVQMHLIHPKWVQENLEKAKFRIKRSAPMDDFYQVTIECTVARDGRCVVGDALFYAKKDGSEWKYDGNIPPR